MMGRARRSDLIMGLRHSHDRWEPCLLHLPRPTHATITNQSSPHFAEALTSPRFYRAHRDDGHGHPAYDPKLSLGVLLYGYCLGCAIHQTVVRCCPANTTRIGAGTDRLRTLGLHSRFLARTPSRLVCLRGCASQRAFRE